MGFSTQVKYRLAQNITEVLGPQKFFLAPKLWAATNVCSSYFIDSHLLFFLWPLIEKKAELHQWGTQRSSMSKFLLKDHIES